MDEQSGADGQPDSASQDSASQDNDNTFTPANLDIYGLPMGQQRASDHEIQLDPLAVFDHFDMAQCLGFQGASFHTAQRI